MAATFSRTNNLYQQNNGKCDKGYKKNGPLVFLAQGGKEGKEKNWSWPFQPNPVGGQVLKWPKSSSDVFALLSRMTAFY